MQQDSVQLRVRIPRLQRFSVQPPQIWCPESSQPTEPRAAVNVCRWPSWPPNHEVLQENAPEMRVNSLSAVKRTALPLTPRCRPESYVPELLKVLPIFRRRGRGNRHIDEPSQIRMPFNIVLFNLSRTILIFRYHCLILFLCILCSPSVNPVRLHTSEPTSLTIILTVSSDEAAGTRHANVR
jgi:hypothetical protein